MPLTKRTTTVFRKHINDAGDDGVRIVEFWMRFPQFVGQFFFAISKLRRRLCGTKRVVKAAAFNVAAAKLEVRSLHVTPA